MDADFTAREQLALARLRADLLEDFASAHPPERVDAAIERATCHFENHPERDLVPVLIGRMVRTELTSPPPDATASEPPAEPAVSGAPTETTPADPGPGWRSMVGASPRPTPPANPPPAVAEQPAAPAPTAGPPAASGQAVPHPSRPGWLNETLLTRVGATLVVGAVLTLVIAGLWPQSTSIAAPKAGAAPPAAAPQAPTRVQGVVGSEKLGFFTDPAVIAEFAHDGFSVRVEGAGSREIATSIDLTHEDFAFPSSLQAAQTIQRERAVNSAYTPFSSPMAIATFQPIVDLLTAAGLVQRQDGVLTFDMAKYLALVQAGTRWDQLPGNTTYPVPKAIVISTTDPRTSNSAEMYLAVAGYVANNDTIVAGVKAEDTVLPILSRLFLEQGYTENTSSSPFEDYLAEGAGATPMVWIYEAQFVEAAVANRIKSGMVLMYPSPTVISTHTLVPLDPAGDRIGQLLCTDPRLQELAARHGFRPNDPAPFAEVLADNSVPAAADVVDVVDTPTYDTLQHLLDGVAQQYH